MCRRGNILNSTGLKKIEDVEMIIKKKYLVEKSHDFRLIFLFCTMYDCVAGFWLITLKVG